MFVFKDKYHIRNFLLSYFIFVLEVILRPSFTCGLVHIEETLSEGHVERVDRLHLPATLLQISDRFSSTGATTTALLVVTFHPVQSLEISHYVDRVFRQQGFLGEILRLRRSLSVQRETAQKASSCCDKKSVVFVKTTNFLQQFNKTGRV